MISVIDRNNINQEKWNTCISNSVQVGSFTAYTWYLDIVCKKWFGIVYQDYKAVFPVAYNSKYGIKYIYQPFFTRHFGVFSPKNDSHFSIEKCLGQIPADYKFIEFSINESEIKLEQEYSFKRKVYQTLSLNSPYESLFNAYSKNAKRNIKKAQGFNLQIKKHTSPKQLVGMFKKSKAASINELRNKDYQILKTLIQTIIKQGMGEIIEVYEGEILCASAFYVKYNNRYHFLKSAVSDTGKTNGAMFFLLDSFIKENANTPFLIDFGGSSIASVAEFNKKFAAKDCIYLQLKKNTLPILIRKFKK